MHAGMFIACRKITHLLTATNTTDFNWKAYTSQFANNTSSIKAFRKENPYSYVHEIELYLVGVQDDVGKRASMTLSQLSKFIVWPEVK